MSEETPSGRRRDADASRAALLAAATDLFTRRGYDRTTVRDIATGAGVNQALLFRYFGSKDGLFAAVIANQARELLDAGPAEELPRRILRRMLDPDQSPAADHPLYAVLRSGGNDSAARAFRHRLGERYAAVLSSLSAAADAEVRADLVLAWLLGIGLLRSVLTKEPLASAEPEQLTGHVLRGISTLLERVATDSQATEADGDRHG